MVVVVSGGGGGGGNACGGGRGGNVCGGGRGYVCGGGSVCGGGGSVCRRGLHVRGDARVRGGGFLTCILSSRKWGGGGGGGAHVSVHMHVVDMTSLKLIWITPSTIMLFGSGEK